MAFERTGNTWFNDLTVGLDDEAFFPSGIYERTKDNPNPVLSFPCILCDDSLDEYAGVLTEKILSALKA